MSDKYYHEKSSAERWVDAMDEKELVEELKHCREVLKRLQKLAREEDTGWLKHCNWYAEAIACIIERMRKI